jgi:hypothetical protein
MALPFARSLRSFHADSFQPSLLLLGIAVTLLLIWTAWFAWARIPVYTVGQIVKTTPEGLITAVFHTDTQGRIQVGQSAHVYLQGAPDSPSHSIPATVIQVIRQVAEAENVVQVELYAELNLASAQIFFDTLHVPSGRVEIEVEHVSPAFFLLSSKQLSTTSVSSIRLS